MTASIHEFTHAPTTYDAWMADNAYGYAVATALMTDLAVLNADTHALFWGTICLGC